MVTRRGFPSQPNSLIGAFITSSFLRWLLIAFGKNSLGGVIQMDYWMLPFPVSLCRHNGRMPHCCIPSVACPAR